MNGCKRYILLGENLSRIWKQKVRSEHDGEGLVEIYALGAVRGKKQRRKKEQWIKFHDVIKPTR